MSLTKEQLLLPRYRVIAGYPGNPFPVGSVLESVSDATELFFALPNWKPGMPDISAEEITKYPHLFQPAHWSDNRLLDEFPDYLAFLNKSGAEEVYKISEKFPDSDGYVRWVECEGENDTYNPDIFHRPATQEEYEASKSKKP